MDDVYRRYRPWFYAAAAYNLLWGAAVVINPGPLLHLAGMRDRGAIPLAQVIGMMVGVYAYGYYLLARAPDRYAALIWIGLAGKTFGPIGFLYLGFLAEVFTPRTATMALAAQGLLVMLLTRRYWVGMLRLREA